MSYAESRGNNAFDLWPRNPQIFDREAACFDMHPSVSYRGYRKDT